MLSETILSAYVSPIAMSIIPLNCVSSNYKTLSSQCEDYANILIHDRQRILLFQKKNILTSNYLKPLEGLQTNPCCESTHFQSSQSASRFLLLCIQKVQLVHRLFYVSNQAKTPHSLSRESEAGLGVKRRRRASSRVDSAAEHNAGCSKQKLYLGVTFTLAANCGRHCEKEETCTNVK